MPGYEPTIMEDFSRNELEQKCGSRSVPKATRCVDLVDFASAQLLLASLCQVFVKKQFIGGSHEPKMAPLSGRLHGTGCNDGGMGGTLPLLANGKIKDSRVGCRTLVVGAGLNEFLRKGVDGEVMQRF